MYYADSDPTFHALIYDEAGRSLSALVEAYMSDFAGPGGRAV
jgi:hypothetical protein